MAAGGTSDYPGVLNMARATKARRGGARGGRFEVEGLESRQLLAYTFSFVPLAPPGVIPSSIVGGPGGNPWVAVSAVPEITSVGTAPTVPAEIGELGASTGTVTYQAVPTAAAQLVSLIDGPGGALYFGEYDSATRTSAIAVVNPTTRAITEFPLGLANAQIDAITAGADGNIYFTDAGNNALGEFVVNDPAHKVTETALPALNQQPGAITAAPNGLIFLGTVGGLASFNPTTQAFIQVALPNPGTFPTGSVTATSFALGGDGNLYFSDTSSYYVTGARAPSHSYALASVNPAVPLTSAGVTLDAGAVASAVTAEPSGNIGFIDASTSPGGIGEFNVTTRTATSTPVTAASQPFAIAAGPGGTLDFTLAGAVGVATPIPSNVAAITGVVYNAPFGATPGGNSSMVGQVVYLDLGNDGKLDPGDPSAVTDQFGTYVFTGLAPGTYTVRVAPFAGEVVSYPSGASQSVTASGGQNAAVGPIGLAQVSTILPLALNGTPFGANPPDIQTAEATAYYETILNRAPDAAGLAADVSYLKGGGSLQALALSFFDSAEYESGAVASYYQTFLGRAGSTGEVAAWVSLMQQGLTAEQVATDFLLSSEFNAKYTADGAFVRALYEDVLGRRAASPEVAGWVSALTSGTSRSQVAAAFVDSPESQDRLIGSLFRIFVAGEPDYTPYEHQIDSGVPLAEVAAGLASSVPFIQRANSAVAG